ncbi:hypothetical protein WNY58_10180 [Neptuniibacter pectenicola]|jgi:hypothetical protein|uniref:Uncharacterized protein n=1 Tax=Neptuniibacter pectenicola TaxID=1806669 RepID=A0ABU9TU83_9GAMM|nr:MAG: hypothetical protein AXW15_03130 [Neptuniibacter sp. Phe_28]
MPKLIKDFRNYQFVYYWYEKDAGKVSPYFPTLNHAEDWFVQQQRVNYPGPERRKPACDKHHTTRRRAADTTIKVDLDISREKISELKQLLIA